MKIANQIEVKMLALIQVRERLLFSLKIRFKKLPFRALLVLFFAGYIYSVFPVIIDHTRESVFHVMVLIINLGCSMVITVYILTPTAIAFIDRYQSSHAKKQALLKPFTKVVNPIITKDLVTDRLKVKGVADPFIVLDKGRYHLFFEVVHGKNPQTGTVSDEIGHAYSDNLIDWHYTQIVLSMEEHGHRSAYPNVFKVEGEWYMVPDTSEDIILYQATLFPYQWKKVATLLATSTRPGYVDTNVFKLGDTWYLTTTGGVLGHNGVGLYFNCSGDWKNDQWKLHPEGVIIPHTEIEGGLRGAGNPIVYEDYVLLPIQVTPIKSKIYGEYTKLIKLGNLTPSSVVVTDFGKLTSRKKDGGWAHRSMHHVSHADYVTKKIFAVDGTSRKEEYSIGLYMQ